MLEVASTTDLKAEQDRNAKNAVKAQGATEAATAVADAVKRVADAAVAEVSKVKTVAGGDFVVSGHAGGRIIIDGPAASFGTNGTVKLNGVQIRTREWGAQHIVGELPADAVSGEVVVHVDEKTQKRAYLNL